MDILKMLQENSDEIYDEELSFLIAELETGDYSKEYISQCMIYINTIKYERMMNKEPINKHKPKKSDTSNIILDPSKLITGYSNNEINDLSIEDQIKYNIENIRVKEKHNELFAQFVKENAEFTEEVVEKIFEFLYQNEIEELLINKSFSENFLEKYFFKLDKNLIAKYQFFSEEFYIKHFDDLSSKLVLQKGVNEWRTMEKRSNKLKLFLRLKGVKI